MPRLHCSADAITQLIVAARALQPDFASGDLEVVRESALQFLPLESRVARQQTLKVWVRILTMTRRCLEFGEALDWPDVKPPPANLNIKPVQACCPNNESFFEKFQKHFSQSIVPAVQLHKYMGLALDILANSKEVFQCHVEISDLVAEVAVIYADGHLLLSAVLANHKPN